jgi:hypothetical protein
MNNINNMKLAFGYKMRCGKDTACDYMIKTHGGKKLSFASPIYDILHYAQKRCGITQEKDREFLQYIGTEWGRKKDENLWVNLLLKNTVLTNNEIPTNFFVSDLRFLNEFYALKNNGWTCIKIIRSEFKQTHSHISETQLDDLPDNEWDYIIYNDDSLEEFYKKLNNIFT